MKDSLALRIKIARIRKGLTQHELGMLIGEPAYNVTRYECSLAIPKPDSLTRIREALGMKGGV